MGPDEVLQHGYQAWDVCRSTKRLPVPGLLDPDYAAHRTDTAKIRERSRSVVAVLPSHITTPQHMVTTPSRHPPHQTQARTPASISRRTATMGFQVREHSTQSRPRHRTRTRDLMCTVGLHCHRRNSQSRARRRISATRHPALSSLTCRRRRVQASSFASHSNIIHAIYNPVHPPFQDSSTNTVRLQHPSID